MTNRDLRRAAILIATLDTESADALLGEMSAEQATMIRNAIMELGDINVIEQQEVMEQFVGKPACTEQPAAQERTQPRVQSDDTSVELDPELASKLDRTGDESAGVPPPVASSKWHPDQHATDTTQPAPFAFLESVAPAELARILAAEHPQTAAIVVAHLSPARAADVIGHLPLPQQSDTLMRIARLTTPHPDVIRDLEHEIQALLSNRQSFDQVGPQGLAKVEAILQHAAGSARQKLVADLAQQDRALVLQLRVTGTPVARPPEPVAPPGGIIGPQQDHIDSTAKPFVHDKSSNTPDPTRVTFADLETLDEKALALLLQHVTSNTTLLALAGASHPFVQRILAQLPDREADQLERKIRNIGPLRLDDVQRAQRQLTDIAQQFVNEGKLVIPGKQRLSVAA